MTSLSLRGWQYLIVTTRVNRMSNFKLIAAASIRANLTKAVTLKRDTTISALWHSLIADNVSFATGMRQSDMADFDSVLRQLFPLQWDKQNEVYKHSAKRAAKSAERLDTDLGGMRQQFKAGDKASRADLLQEFVGIIMAYYNANVERTKQGQLSDDAKRDNAKARFASNVQSLMKQGVSGTELLDMLVQAGVDVSAYVPVLER